MSYGHSCMLRSWVVCWLVFFALYLLIWQMLLLKGMQKWARIPGVSCDIALYNRSHFWGPNKGLTRVWLNLHLQDCLCAWASVWVWLHTLPMLLFFQLLPFSHTIITVLHTWKMNGRVHMCLCVVFYVASYCIAIHFKSLTLILNLKTSRYVFLSEIRSMNST